MRGFLSRGSGRRLGILLWVFPVLMIVASLVWLLWPAPAPGPAPTPEPTPVPEPEEKSAPVSPPGVVRIESTGGPELRVSGIRWDGGPGWARRPYGPVQWVLIGLAGLAFLASISEAAGRTAVLGSGAGGAVALFSQSEDWWLPLVAAASLWVVPAVGEAVESATPSLSPVEQRGQNKTNSQPSISQ